MTKKQKKALKRIIVGALLFIAASALENTGVLQGIWTLFPYLAAFATVGGDVVTKAFRNILRGQVFDENFLMSIATIGAFFTGEYGEGVAVMLFYQVGELFQSYAVAKSRRSISDLMNIRPDYANVERDGEPVSVDPDEVVIGEEILVKAGEKIPLDGQIIEGKSMLDTSALTGEAVPREVESGMEVLSGCVNMSGLLRIRVTKPFGESTVAKILELVENASSRKSKSENFITKFARYYTPFVVTAALVLAIIPPIVTGGSLGEWIHRALIFLVISCPCALVISVPLGFFGGIGGASRDGILVKGSNYLEALAGTEIVVFDKTGTLTKGSFSVVELQPENRTEAELLELAACAEVYSNHPISLSLQEAFKGEIDKSRIAEPEEISGHGVKAVVDGKMVYAGNEKLMNRQGIACVAVTKAGTVVHVAVDGEYAGYIRIADELKVDAGQAIAKLKRCRVKRTVMLTGDNEETAKAVAAELGIDEVYAGLLPGDKVDKVEELFKNISSKGKLVFVGDGINDAPVLSRADIGIAMGALGSDAAIEAADVVIMTDEPSKIASAIQISRRTLSIVKQNIVFALGVKGFFLLLGAFGMANMWEAVFADVGVSVIAILNAMRALKKKD
ncbi:MAG: cadmium-translocating P-type ATPase [Lachnospiraceae bacterium]|nr:cadmium-translocating P-type ATPase [Lachnospiraceae bacterium]